MSCKTLNRKSLSKVVLILVQFLVKVPSENTIIEFIEKVISLDVLTMTQTPKLKRLAQTITFNTKTLQAKSILRQNSQNIFTRSLNNNILILTRKSEVFAFRNVHQID